MLEKVVFLGRNILPLDGAWVDETLMMTIAFDVSF